MTTYSTHVGNVTIVWPVDQPTCTCPEGDLPDDEACFFHGEGREWTP